MAYTLKLEQDSCLFYYTILIIILLCIVLLRCKERQSYTLNSSQLSNAIVKDNEVVAQCLP